MVRANIDEGAVAGLTDTIKHRPKDKLLAALTVTSFSSKIFRPEFSQSIADRKHTFESGYMGRI
jgi:hypothetical protein